MPEIQHHPADSQTARALGAQEVLRIPREDGTPAAQVALWPRTIHTLGNYVIGFLGAFHADSEELGKAVLEAAEPRLRQAGVTLAIGPLDGSTWRSYRFVISSQRDIPPFVMEPVNPAWYPTLWESLGYDPVVADYYSALAEDLRHRDPQVGRAALRLAATGVELHALNLENWEQELVDIHELSLIAFAGNFLYEPLPLAHFTAGYAKIRPLVDPRLVLLAKKAGKLVGFSFSLPNPPLPGSVIIKTVAVLPGREFAGLGAVLVEETQQRAADLGYQAAIHALMHEDNKSLNLSNRYGKPFRKYSLLGKDLDQP